MRNFPVMAALDDMAERFPELADTVRRYIVELERESGLYQHEVTIEPGGDWLVVQPGEPGGIALRVNKSVINYVAMELACAVQRGLEAAPFHEPPTPAEEQEIIARIAGAGKSNMEMARHIATGMIYRIVWYASKGFCGVMLPVPIAEGPAGQA